MLALKVVETISTEHATMESVDNLLSLASEYTKRYLIHEKYQFLIVARGAGSLTRQSLTDLATAGGTLTTTNNVIRNVVRASRKNDADVSKIIYEYIKAVFSWSTEQLNKKLRDIDKSLSETAEAKKKRLERQRLRESSICLSQARRFGSNPWAKEKFSNFHHRFRNSLYVISHTMFMNDKFRTMILGNLHIMQGMVIIGPVANCFKYMSIAPANLVKFSCAGKVNTYGQCTYLVLSKCTTIEFDPPDGKIYATVVDYLFSLNGCNEICRIIYDVNDDDDASDN